MTTWLSTWYPEGPKDSASTTIPVRPTRPSNPFVYTGYRLKQTASSTIPTATEVQLVQEGGGGQLTTGILTPSGGGKSFGVFGQGVDIGLAEDASKAMEKGWTLDPAHMTDSGAKAKYLMVSIFPKSNAWAGQVDGAPAFEIEVGAYSWGTASLIAP